MYIMCVCLFSALSRRVGALQMPIMIMIMIMIIMSTCVCLCAQAQQPLALMLLSRQDTTERKELPTVAVATGQS